MQHIELIATVVFGVAGAAILYGLGAWADRRNDRRAGRLPRIARPMPRRYAGCITCEGAEMTSVQAMCRHQLADHDGTILW